MDDSSERRAIRWSGVAGMAGSLSLLAVFAFLAAFVGLETVAGEAELRRFPEVLPYRIVENAFYLLALALWTFHTAGLFLVLRRTRFAAALAGGVFMGLGLAILAAGAVPHTATAPISALYHAPGATPETRAALLAVWTALQGLTDMFFVTGLALTPLGMGCFGLSMMRAPGYGPVAGWLALAFALAGTVAALRILVVPDDVAALGIFALVFFHAVVGWRSSRPAVRSTRIFGNS
ncbi:MAG: hypothetical protein QNJ13_09950 [Paracoccaceae bacterium]|nr:hypothetical protein [Paracoccaceae bacterium]